MDIYTYVGVYAYVCVRVCTIQLRACVLWCGYFDIDLSSGAWSVDLCAWRFKIPLPLFAETTISKTIRKISTIFGSFLRILSTFYILNIFSLQVKRWEEIWKESYKEDRKREKRKEKKERERERKKEERVKET